MDLDPSRLRRGEWVAGIGGVLLLVFVFALPWYEVRAPYRVTNTLAGGNTSPNGWTALSHVRWLLLIAALAALALAWLQATRRAPALPVSFSVIVTVLALIAVLVLVYRVLINEPGADSIVDQRPGAYLGLASGIAILYGGFASMRQEGIEERDGPGEIPVASLDQPGAPPSSTPAGDPTPSSRS